MNISTYLSVDKLSGWSWLEAVTIWWWTLYVPFWWALGITSTGYVRGVEWLGRLRTLATAHRDGFQEVAGTHAPISTAWLAAAQVFPNTWCYRCLELPLCWMCRSAPAWLQSACVWRLLDEAPLQYAFLHLSVHLRNSSSFTLCSPSGYLHSSGFVQVLVFSSMGPLSCMCAANVDSSQSLALSISRRQPERTYHLKQGTLYQSFPWLL